MKKTPKNIIKNLRELIANDQLNPAIKRLKNLLENSPELNEVILQSARLQSITQQVRTGQVNFEDSKVTRNQITAGLLDLITEIANQEQQNETIHYEKSKSLLEELVANSPDYIEFINNLNWSNLRLKNAEKSILNI